MARAVATWPLMTFWNRWTVKAAGHVLSCVGRVRVEGDPLLLRAAVAQ